MTQIIRRLVEVLTITAACSLPAESLRSQVTWVNPGVGAFEVGSNWAGGFVPQGFQDIVLNNGGTAQISNNADVSNATIDGSSTIEILPGLLSDFTPDQLYLGLSGTGTLIIGAQALAATAGDVYAGYGASGNGVITMNGGTLSPYNFYAGYEGTATVDMVNGSALDSTRGWVGWGLGSQGAMNLDASTWTISELGQPQGLRVGYQGTGTIRATNSQISALTLTLGETNTAASGTLTMNGGTTAIVSGIVVGNVGAGTLGLSNGATVSSYGLTVGALAGSTGALSVYGSTLTNPIETFVGLSGNGTLTASNAQIYSKALFIARNAGSTSTATVSGGAVTLTEDLHVGSGGDGTLTVHAGSVLDSDVGNVGFLAGSTGVVNILGAAWDNRRAIFVGVSGDGTLNIGNDAAVASESGFIGQDAGSTGTVNVTSLGGWGMTNSLVVGVKGTGHLNVSGGGEVASVWSQVGLDPGASGTVTLSNGTWSNSQTLTIGSRANGSLTAIAGSELSAMAIQLAASNSVTGSLRATNSTISTVNLLAGAGNASAQISAVQLRVLGGSSVVDTLLIDGFSAGNVVVGSGGLTVDTQGGNAQINSELSGAGGLTKTGVGRLRLNTANTYAGGTSIEGGVLELTGNNNLGAGNVSLGTAELRAHTNSSVSGSLGSGVQLLSVSAGQTATFSAGTGQTLTLAPLDFQLGSGTTMQAGSAGNTGNVVFAPTGLVAPITNITVNVAAGTLTAGNTNLETITSIAATTTVAAGATLNFNDQLTGRGVRALNGAGAVNTGVSSNATLVVGSGSFTGTISGQGSFVKNGAGTFTVGPGGDLAVFGTSSVEGGTLLVNGTIGGGLGSLQVNAGGTLGGTGSMGLVNLAGGNLAPGNSPGTILVADLLWSSGNIVFDLGPTQAQSDLIQTGTFTGLGTSYAFDFQDNGWVQGLTYDLITFGGAINIDVNNFSYLNGGGFAGTFATNSASLQFTVTTVPEPGTLPLLALAVAATGAAQFLFRRGRFPGKGD